MSPYARKLAQEFNAAAPIPHAPHDGTVYGPETNTNGIVTLREERQRPPLRPGWVDAVPSYHEWLQSFLESDIGRAFHRNIQSLHEFDPPTNDNAIGVAWNAQLKALHASARHNKTQGYRIYDPFAPLGDLEKPETQAYIDAENDRTQKYISGLPAREKAAAFLRQRWADRAPKEFTIDADSDGCASIKHTGDPWTYPVDRSLAKRHCHLNGRPIAAVGGNIIAQIHRGHESDIVTFPADHPEQVKTLIIGTPGNRIRGAFMHKDRLLVSMYHNCADELKVYTPEGVQLADVPLPVCKIDKAAVDEATGKLRLTLRPLTRAPGDWLYDLGTNALEPVDNTPGLLDGCIVEQIWAKSAGDEMIPMFIVRRPDVALDGTAALKIFAYGAARIPVFPLYSEEMAYWVSSGGIYAMANIRGGDELGEDWAQKGMGMNRSNVLHDVANCASDLHARNYSSPERTVFHGRSNGGWLAIECARKFPYYFGAVVSDVPIADLYNLQHGYRSYPDTNSEKGLRELLKLSPYHNLQPGQGHAPLMITAGDSDTIANTWQALKMTAALQENGGPDGLCLLRVRRGSGHLPAFVSNDEMVAERADVHAFIEHNIGPIDQNEYKASSYCNYQSPPAPQPAARSPGYAIG